ncbi:MAG TPA: hypothetical protein DGF10_02520, partial [Acidimicrobiaceae bacterium]|nr:hypothetical protein [Acidimicrobiaceae bacterium]
MGKSGPVGGSADLRSLEVVKVGLVRRPGVGARWRWVVAAVLLAASTLVGLSVPPAGAWSSDDGAVAVFGDTSSDYGNSVAVDS